MNKRIMLLALGAVSALMLAVPAMASAELDKVSLHLSPSPVGAKAIDDIGPNPKLSTHDDNFIECDSVSGSATFETGGTTGNMTLTFGPNCKTNVGGECTNTGVVGNNHITVASLPFHLATVVHRGANPHTAAGSPGVLVTPVGGVFAKFTCHKIAGFLTVDKEVTGTGVVGTITSPACGAASTEAIVKFQAAELGTQTHDTIKNTTTTYTLESNGISAAQEAEAKITMGGNTTLVCT